MKKNWIYLFLSMAIVAMPMTSCSNDDDESKPKEEQQHDPTSDADQVAIAAYDALEWLQGSLVLVDKNGEVVRRVYGKPLDRSDSTVIYLPVIDPADAEDTFLGWVAPDKGTTQTDSGYDYTLTDPEGNYQGAVSFIVEDGENGEIARMTVAPGTNLKQVSEVKFIKAEAWPENAVSERYTAGKTYWLEGERYEWAKSRDNQTMVVRMASEKLEFYCLQGNDQGNNDAILVWLSPDNANSWQTVGGHEQYVQTHAVPADYLAAGLNYRLPHLCELMQVMNFYQSNRNAWNNMLKVMDGKGYQWSAGTSKTATRTSEFVFGGNEDELLLLDLDQAVPTLGTVNKKSPNHYRYMQVRVISWR